MGRTSFFPWQAPSIVHRVGKSALFRLIRDRRIVGCARTGGELSARVFDADGLAYQPSIRLVPGEYQTSCDCGAEEPCLHVAALLIEAYRRDLLEDAEETELGELAGELAGERVIGGSDGLFAFEAGIPANPNTGGNAGAAGPDALSGELNAAQSQSGTVPGDDFAYPEGTTDSPSPAHRAVAVGEPLITIQGNRDGTGIEFRFRYPWGEIRWRDPRRTFDLDGTAQNRDGEAEQAFVRRVRKLISPELVFERGPYADLFKDAPVQDLQIEIPPAEFLMQKGRILLEEGIEVRVENRPVRIDRELNLTLSSDLDLLDIRARLVARDGQPESSGASPIRIDRELLERGMAEADGQFILLRDSDLRQLEYLHRRGMTSDGVVSASGINLVLLERIYEQVSAEDRQRLDGALEKKRILEDLGALPNCEPPRGLTTNLRNYQRYGYNWLNYMLANNMNPCLADDMGLGKTLQTLSLLLSRKERGESGPYLVACPVVTLANWESEIRRFVPDLDVMIHRGEARARTPSDLTSCDVTLVSYQTLRIDLALFLEIEWDVVVLDEAHYIKNIQSQLFKTVRSLKAAHRISLTGTPIENSVMELFAQMDFLNPGLLGSPRQFYSDFFRGIQRDGDENLLDELKEIVRPFILRRTKDEVLDELPGKELLVRYVDMENPQREAYDFHRTRILEELEAEGDPTAKGTLVFRSLLKLRQLAIHPPLADSAYRDVPSAKLEALELLLGDLLEEDHKVLIFSQFLGSLEAAADLCRRREWRYVLLTGSTRDRDREVARFQGDPEIKVFLLSLKAGGVGINLTAADYVVIFDPWWNPAAEQQAIDRAHRMGQTKPVIAYKLIVRDSIEEKILRLQEQKSNLADEIINAGGSLLSHLGREEMLGLFS
jgi:superfamily II DNA or RNA helicase